MLEVTFLYSILPLIFAVALMVMLKKRTAKIIVGIIFVLLFLFYLMMTYLTLPSKNLLSIVGYNTLDGIFLAAATWHFADEREKDSWGNPKHEDKLPLSNKTWIGMTTAVVLLVFVSLAGELHSYMSVKPTWQSIQKVYSKSTEAPTFKRGETPIALAPKTVINRVKKASSDLPHSQYFSISDQVQAQYLNGKPVYVVPVEYNGFFEMNKAGSIPGYFVVDATKQNATPKFIHKPYKYASSAYFSRDASRQIYRHTVDWLDLGSVQLEIDDNGNPYWVQTLYKSEAFSHRVNYNKLHVAVMNAQTGSVKVYSVENMPKFIDEGITTETAAKINHDFGKYKYGFWNWSKTGIMKPTGNGVEDGVTSVFNRDGSISYFTDFTTDKTGSDSALGYSMINARTGKLTFYRANNIMDSDGAINNAGQDYKAQQWKANMPILYNVNNRPTWVMTILDSTHAIRGYYYLDANDQSVYGTGSNPTSALDAFRQALVNSGNSAGNTNKTTTKKLTGIVDRAVVVSNKNKVMFTLKGSNVIYTVNTNDFDFANLIRPSDKVSFKANIVDKKSIGNVSEFKDSELN